MANVEQEAISFIGKWWITTFMLGSLMMQLALLVTGGTRMWNAASQLVAWIAYNSSDYTATTALASLAQAAGPDKSVFAVWAPILLLHLGGPDNICAYARADSELWLRHGFTMILQTLSAVYVIASCAREWKYAVVSSCIAIVGAIKYAERTLALKRASQGGIIKSAQPLYMYMLGEGGIRLPVRGNGGSSFDNISLGPVHGDQNPRYHYILQGEDNWYRNFQKEENQNLYAKSESACKSTRELVNLNDVVCSDVLNPRRTDAELTSPFLLWCLGYALFQMYKRRLCNLHMYEWRQNKTRQLFLVSNDILKSEEEVLHVLDVELRFLFDFLYSKTPYTKLGTLLRFVTTALLVVSGVFVFRLINFQDQDRVIFQAKAITALLLVAALAVELYQLARLVLSDWTRVRLVCMYIEIGECHQSFHRYFCMAILRKFMSVLGWSCCQRGKYWRNRIGQYSMVQEPTENGILHRYYFQLKRRLPQYEESTEAVITCKRYVLRKALDFAGKMLQRGVGRRSLSNINWILEDYEATPSTIILASFGARPGDNTISFDIEHWIATWHVVTSMCELLVPVEAAVAGNEAQDFQMSKYLSRYTTYLLKHRTELLPIHADIGRRVAADTERDLNEKLSRWTQAEVHQFVMTNNDSLKNEKAVAKLLQDYQQRWSLIADVWTHILVLIAAANQLQDHLNRLSEGGELVTHLGVLLGHMGYGDQ